MDVYGCKVGLIYEYTIFVYVLNLYSQVSLPL